MECRKGLIVNRDLSRYDDRRELADYLWHNFPQLFSEQEQLAARTLRAEEKARNADSDAQRKMLLKAWSRRGQPEIDSLLADGPEVFWIRAAERVVVEQPEELLINRCPACDRVVATPRARQCLWCGHDWHAVEPGG